MKFSVMCVPDGRVSVDPDSLGSQDPDPDRRTSLDDGVPVECGLDTSVYTDDTGGTGYENMDSLYRKLPSRTHYRGTGLLPAVELSNQNYSGPCYLSL